MNSYIVLSNKENHIKLICDKINWWCFFLGPFWALYNGIWHLATILLSISSLNIILINIYHFDIVAIEIFRVLISSMAALYANSLLIKKYQKSEYKMVDIIQSSDEKTALQRFFDKNFTQQNN